MSNKLQSFQQEILNMKTIIKNLTKDKDTLFTKNHDLNIDINHIEERAIKKDCKTAKIMYDHKKSIAHLKYNQQEFKKDNHYPLYK